jgi:hypothetical protein
MKRGPELEQIHRLSVKTFDRDFVACFQDGLGCSLFEAQALTELVMMSGVMVKVLKTIT